MKKILTAITALAFALLPVVSFGLADASAPTKMTIPFGNSAGGAYIRTVPVASQIGITNGAASYTDGFPPLNFTPVSAGGVPPFGQDMNGIFNATTALTRWYSAGGPIYYDGTYQTAIGGYPKGACVQSATTTARFWCSMTENNVTNPDTGGAGWQYINNAVNATNVSGGTVSGTVGTLTGTAGISITGNAATATNATNVTGTIGSSVTATTQSSTDSSTKVATTAFVQSATIGNGQTLQNMTGSATGCTAARANSVTCTNSTGRPIMIYVRWCRTGTNNPWNATIVISSSLMSEVWNPDAATTSCTTLNALVPNGASYFVTAQLSAAVDQWFEYR